MADKPEPQRIGVSGFKVFGAMGESSAPASTPATAATTDSKPAQPINWATLARLPPFQLFIWKRCKGPKDVNWATWARQRIPLEIKAMGEQAFFDAYCQWHTASGKWKNETVYGKSKE